MPSSFMSSARAGLKPRQRIRDAQSKLAEAIGLAEAIDLEIVDTMVAPLLAPKPATYIGSGKVAEIAKRVAEAEAELVVVNAQLSPIQQRNLETEWKAKVLDRTGLILEIFGRRASTKEGILQVELAHLNYQKSRLVRSWTHLGAPARRLRISSVAPAKASSKWTAA